jgi:hypothetical protein
MNCNAITVLLMGLAAVLLSSGTAFAGATPIPIPEPSSLALIAAGVAGVAWVRFRRRK